MATSKCDKPRGDEVVHVLASAAQVLFSVMSWWDKDCGKLIFQQQIWEFKGRAVYRASSWDTGFVMQTQISWHHLFHNSKGSCIIMLRLTTVKWILPCCYWSLHLFDPLLVNILVFGGPKEDTQSVWHISHSVFFQVCRHCWSSRAARYPGFSKDSEKLHEK